jgi:membrane protease subunit HflK
MNGWRNKKALLAAIAALIAVFAFGGIYHVGQGEKAVVLTLGMEPKERGPGVHWRMPIVQTVKCLPAVHSGEYGFRTKQRRPSGLPADEIARESAVVTSDSGIVIVNAVYQYNISNAEDYFFGVEDPKKTIALAFESALRASVQSQTLDGVFLSKSQIEADALYLFQEQLARYPLGVDAVRVGVKSLSLPDAVLPAYAELKKARAGSLRIMADAQNYEATALLRAQDDAEKTMQDAQLYASVAVNKANSDAAIFNGVYDEYRKAPDITRQRLYYEAMADVLSRNRNKIIVNSGAYSSSDFMSFIEEYRY